MDNIQTQMAEFTGTANIIPERNKLLSGTKEMRALDFSIRQQEETTPITRGILWAEPAQKAFSCLHYCLVSHPLKTQLSRILMAGRIETNSFPYS